jgi:hypothetical protein
MGRRSFLAASCVVLVLAAAGCGGGSDGGHSYPSAAEHNFMASCTGQSNGTESGCRCVLERLEAAMPYSEFKRVDTEVATGFGLSGAEKRKVVDAISACRHA